MNTNLTPEIVYEVLSSIFPKQNDYYQSDYIEEFNELKDFGINTKEALNELIDKHKKIILEIDSDPIDEQQIKWYREDNSIENLDHKLDNGYWFALPGLLRLCLELEFGKKYRDYSNKRDGGKN